MDIFSKYFCLITILEISTTHVDAQNVHYIFSIHPFLFSRQIDLAQTFPFLQNLIP